jgi:drug/metabolite transporter (DMT)-like permease
MMPHLTAIQKGYTLGLGAAIIWSGFILVSRLGGISALNYLDIIALRYITCAFVVLPIWWFKYRFNLLQTKYIVIALIGGLSYALCTFQGFQLAPASHGALLLPGAMPLFIFILSGLFGQSAFSLQKFLAVFIISLGIAALFLGQHSINDSTFQGDLLFLGGAFCWGLFSVLIKHWEISPWEVTISLALLTSLVYLPFYIVCADKNISIELWPQMLTQMFYQGILATIIQMLLYVRAVELIGAASMGSLMAFVPLIAGVAALFVFQEAMTSGLLIGLTLVVLGSWLNHSQRIQQYFISNAKPSN